MIKWEVHTKHFCYEVWWLSPGRPSIKLFELQDKLDTFPLMGHHFYLKEWLTDTLCLFRCGYLADFFVGINEVTVSQNGKQLTVCVANDKIWGFKWKSEFWTTCIHYSEFDSECPNTWRLHQWQ